MEPSHFDRRLKLLFLTRLISLCEHNYNLVELGPRGTGKNGLVTFYVLAVMQMKTRRVQIAGITPSPTKRRNFVVRCFKPFTKSSSAAARCGTTYVRTFVIASANPCSSFRKRSSTTWPRRCQFPASHHVAGREFLDSVLLTTSSSQHRPVLSWPATMSCGQRLRRNA